ncbi:unnamed protein product [Rhizoctonia solani]|uniref:Heat shock 70 kDa protein 12A n=1 Tax=Rhizoctonia solani TaxID=456999 RepID=A0A8H3C239_9AGAM|nr:unnamed protein product [Rhizoctonia solani]
MKVYAPEVWTGPPKIILGIDIGATQSAVSFSYLHPGGPHHVIRVTEWPGQPAHTGQGRVPTLIWYDKYKKPVSFGAEALLPEVEEEAEDNGWQRVSLFKLHLHPEAVTKANKLMMPPLIDGLSLLTIYTDFLRYLLEHIKNFFPNKVLDGRNVWEACHRDMTIVLTHPNGWSFQEQSTLRQAAINAGYISDIKANSNVVFVSEAEASTHFCLFDSDLYTRLEANVTFVVCDAGGSTVDTTAYRVVSTKPIFQIEEIKSSACTQAGGVFIDDAFRVHLLPILDRIAYDEDSRKRYLRTGVTHFEENAKRAFEFENIVKNYRVTLGTGRLVYQQSRIRQGSMTLDGHTIQGFFDYSARQTVASILQQMERGCKHLFLVGGFGESRYLRKVVESELLAAGHSCSVHVTNDPYAKAVADGAVVWYGHNSVTSRATRMSYGVTIQVKYDPYDPEHQGRKSYLDATGQYKVHGVWSEIAKKDTIMKVDGAIRRRLHYTFKDPNPPPDKFKLSIPLLAIADSEDTMDKYRWSRNKNGCLAKGFEQICTVTADLSGLQGALTKRISTRVYYQLDFSVALQFGGTEINASIEWTEKARKSSNWSGNFGGDLAS